MAEQEHFGKWQGGPMFRKLKRWGPSKENDKISDRAKMRKAVHAQMASHPIVLWCGDQYRNQGTGYLGKAGGLHGFRRSVSTAHGSALAAAVGNV